MLDIAYYLGSRKAIQDMEKSAFWQVPLIGAMADTAYSNILDPTFDGNSTTPFLRGALTGTGASLGWQLGGKNKLLLAALGAGGSNALGSYLAKGG
jgi:hypothetical protein